MPIRADNRKYYDARWRKFRLTMLDRRQRLPALREAAPAAERCPPDPRPDRPAFSGGPVPELPRQERHSPAHRHDPPHPGATARAVLVERGTPPRPLPRPHLAGGVEAVGFGPVLSRLDLIIPLMGRKLGRAGGPCKT